MENSDPSNTSKKSIGGRSSNSHISLSDTESTTSQVDSWHSPLRSESPLRSDDPSFGQRNDDSGANSNRSLVLVDKYHSPVPSPGKSAVPASSGAAAGRKGIRSPWPHSEKQTASENHEEGGNGVWRDQYVPEEKTVDESVASPVKLPSPVVLEVNKMVREELPSGVKKVGPYGGGGLEEGHGGGREDGVGGERRSRTAVASILKRSEMNLAVKKAALGLRVFEVVACLISFSVMAADKTQGWSGDSFDRYKEYR